MRTRCQRGHFEDAAPAPLTVAVCSRASSCGRWTSREDRCGACSPCSAWLSSHFAPSTSASRFFLIPSRGSDDPLVAHLRSWFTVTVCRTAGDLTSTSSLVADPGSGSMNLACLNAWSARPAASYRVSATTSTLWLVPSRSRNVTVQVWTGTARKRSSFALYSPAGQSAMQKAGSLVLGPFATGENPNPSPSTTPFVCPRATTSSSFTSRTSRLRA